MNLMRKKNEVKINYQNLSLFEKMSLLIRFQLLLISIQQSEVISQLVIYFFFYLFMLRRVSEHCIEIYRVEIQAIFDYILNLLNIYFVGIFLFIIRPTYPQDFS